MKKYLFSIILSAIIITIFPIQSTNAKSISKIIKGDKNITNNEIKVSDYNSITLYSSADIIYEQKETASPYLTVEIDNNLFEYIDIQVVNNELVVKQRNSTSINPSKYIIRTNSKQLENATIAGSGSMITKGKIKANKMNLLVKGSGDVFTEGLDVSSLFATVEGSGDIKFEGATKANAIDLFVKGSGDISFDNLVASSISAEVKGLGDIKINGKATNVKYSVLGSGDIKAKQLEAETAICTIAGSGDIEVNATQSLDCNIKGSGDIHYLGNPPHIQRNIKGSGEIKRAK